MSVVWAQAGIAAAVPIGEGDEIVRAGETLEREWLHIDCETGAPRDFSTVTGWTVTIVDPFNTVSTSGTVTSPADGTIRLNLTPGEATAAQGEGYYAIRGVESGIERTVQEGPITVAPRLVGP